MIVVNEGASTRHRSSSRLTAHADGRQLLHVPAREGDGLQRRHRAQHEARAVQEHVVVHLDLLQTRAVCDCHRRRGAEALLAELQELQAGQHYASRRLLVQTRKIEVCANHVRAVAEDDLLQLREPYGSPPLAAATSVHHETRHHRAVVLLHHQLLHVRAACVSTPLPTPTHQTHLLDGAVQTLLQPQSRHALTIYASCVKPVRTHEGQLAEVLRQRVVECEVLKHTAFCSRLIASPTDKRDGRGRDVARHAHEVLQTQVYSSRHPHATTLEHNTRQHGHTHDDRQQRLEVDRVHQVAYASTPPHTRTVHRQMLARVAVGAHDLLLLVHELENGSQQLVVNDYPSTRPHSPTQKVVVRLVVVATAVPHIPAGIRAVATALRAVEQAHAVVAEQLNRLALVVVGWVRVVGRVHVHRERGRQHIAPLPVLKLPVAVGAVLANVGAQEFAALARAHVILVCALEQEPTIAVELAGPAVLLVVHVLALAAPPPVAVELRALALTLVVVVVPLEEDVALRVVLELPASLAVLEVALVVAALLVVQLAVPVELPFLVATRVHQMSLAVVVVAEHAHHLVVRHVHLHHPLVVEVRVVQPLVVVVVLEERVHVRQVEVLVEVQQLLRLAVAVALQLEQVVDDDSDFLGVRRTWR